MITFNDCSTKVYVFRMCRWGLKALRLLAGDNLTHTEREKNSGHTSERSHQKKKRSITTHSGSFIMHATNSSRPTGEGSTKAGDWAININGRFMVLHVPGESPDRPWSVLNTSTT